MGRRSFAALGTSALVASVALGVVACAEGMDGDGGGTETVDAADIEASTPGGPRDATADGPASGPAEAGSNVSAACLDAIAKTNYDFDSSDQGWTHQASDNALSSGIDWPFDPWTRATATTIPCPSGKCWAAEATQKYAQCQRGEVTSPRIDLTACASANVTLVFTHAYAFWSGSYDGKTWFDGGIVELSMDDGSSWQEPPATYPGTVKINPDRGSSYSCALSDQFYVDGKSGFTGTQTTALPFQIAIPNNYLTDKIRVRFMQASGVSSETTDPNESRSATQAGWRVDNVHFSAE